MVDSVRPLTHISRFSQKLRDTDALAAEPAVALTSRIRPAGIIDMVGMAGAEVLLYGGPSGGTCALTIYAVRHLRGDRGPNEANDEMYTLTAVATTTVTIAGAAGQPGGVVNASNFFASAFTAISTVDAGLAYLGELRSGVSTFQNISLHGPGAGKVGAIGFASAFDFIGYHIYLGTFASGLARINGLVGRWSM